MDVCRSRTNADDRLARDANSTVVASIPRTQIFTQDGDLALVAIQQPDQNVLRRALAGTAGAKESENLTRLDRESDVANGGPLAAGIRRPNDGTSMMARSQRL
jgi:hypothetical protein